MTLQQDPHAGQRRGFADMEAPVAALEQAMAGKWTYEGVNQIRNQEVTE